MRAGPFRKHVNLGCANVSCPLCKLCQRRRCDQNFASKYLAPCDVLEAKCGAQIYVVVVDSDSGVLVQSGLDDAHLQMCLIDGRRFEAEGEREDALDDCVLLSNKAGHPLLAHGRSGTLTEDKRVVVPLILGQAMLPDLKVTDSSEALLMGRAPPFRLLVRLTHRSGERVHGVRHALSEPFVVATARVKGAAKAEIPHVDDHVSRIECVGVQTQRKLEDIRAAGEAAGVSDLVLPVNCVTRVGQFRDLVELAEHNKPLRETLKQVLRLTKGWDVARDHVRKCVDTDGRLRVFHPDQRCELGLAFRCGAHNVVDLQRPVGLLRRKQNPAQPNQEMVDVIWLPAQGSYPDAVRRLLPQSFSAWWQPGHPSWAILPLNTSHIPPMNPAGLPSTPTSSFTFTIRNAAAAAAGGMNILPSVAAAAAAAGGEDPAAAAAQAMVSPGTQGLAALPPGAPPGGPHLGGEVPGRGISPPGPMGVGGPMGGGGGPPGALLSAGPRTVVPGMGAPPRYDGLTGASPSPRYDGPGRGYAPPPAASSPQTYIPPTPPGAYPPDGNGYGYGPQPGAGPGPGAYGGAEAFVPDVVHVPDGFVPVAGGGVPMPAPLGPPPPNPPASLAAEAWAREEQRQRHRAGAPARRALNREMGNAQGSDPGARAPREAAPPSGGNRGSREGDGLSPFEDPSYQSLLAMVAARDAGEGPSGRAGQAPLSGGRGPGSAPGSGFGGAGPKRKADTSLEAWMTQHKSLDVDISLPPGMSQMSSLFGSISHHDYASLADLLQNPPAAAPAPGAGTPPPSGDGPAPRASDACEGRQEDAFARVPIAALADLRNLALALSRQEASVAQLDEFLRRHGLMPDAGAERGSSPRSGNPAHEHAGAVGLADMQSMEAALPAYSA